MPTCVPPNPAALYRSLLCLLIRFVVLVVRVGSLLLLWFTYMRFFLRFFLFSRGFAPQSGHHMRPVLVDVCFDWGELGAPCRNNRKGTAAV